MHQNETKSPLPYIVLVTDLVRESKRQALRNDGATVISVEAIKPADWMMPEGNVTELAAKQGYSWNQSGIRPEYLEQLTKLRVFELDQFDRIVYIDSNMALTQRLDPIFDTVEAHTVLKNREYLWEMESADEKQPEDYVLWTIGNGASGPDSTSWPPDWMHEMNAGLFLTRPSKNMFKYYMSFFSRPWSFNPAYTEQALFNVVHRWSGNMPFGRLHHRWNKNYPNSFEFRPDHRAITIHDKFWNTNAPPEVHQFLVEIAQAAFVFHNITLRSNCSLLPHLKLVDEPVT